MDKGIPPSRENLKYNRRHGRPDSKPVRCRMCKRISRDVSWNGYCPDCSIEKVKRVCMSLHDKKGAYFNRWKKGMKKFIRSI